MVWPPLKGGRRWAVLRPRPRAGVKKADGRELRKPNPEGVGAQWMKVGRHRARALGSQVHDDADHSDGQHRRESGCREEKGSEFNRRVLSLRCFVPTPVEMAGRGRHGRLGPGEKS